MSYAYKGFLITFGAGFWSFDGSEYKTPGECEAAIDTLLSNDSTHTCFSCGEQMTLAPSEIVYECECGYWCYSSS